MKISKKGAITISSLVWMVVTLVAFSGLNPVIVQLIEEAKTNLTAIEGAILDTIPTFLVIFIIAGIAIFGSGQEVAQPVYYRG